MLMRDRGCGGIDTYTHLHLPCAKNDLYRLSSLKSSRWHYVSSQVMRCVMEAQNKESQEIALIKTNLKEEEVRVTNPLLPSLSLLLLLFTPFPPLVASYGLKFRRQIYTLYKWRVNKAYKAGQEITQLDDHPPITPPSSPLIVASFVPLRHLSLATISCPYHSRLKPLWFPFISVSPPFNVHLPPPPHLQPPSRTRFLSLDLFSLTCRLKPNKKIVWCYCIQLLDDWTLFPFVLQCFGRGCCFVALQ